MSVQRGNFEHIVMDGGSKDSTLEIVRSYEKRYPVRCFYKPDKCIYEGVWNGFEESTGDIMGYLNADDFYLPWTLATVQAVFDSFPTVDWITGIPNLYSEMTGVAQTGSIIPIYPRNWIRRGWYSPGCMGCLQQESMFWRRSLWQKADLKETLLKYRHTGDYRMWQRFANFAELRTVSAVLASFTISTGQLSWVDREVTLREYGHKPHQNTPPMWARIVSRLACIALQMRVIRLKEVVRR